MIPIPNNFNGEKFAIKYSLDPFTDFKVDKGMLICPSLPELTEFDLIDCVVTPEEFDIIEAVHNRLLAARLLLKNHPWASITQQEWQTYFDANLSNAVIDTEIAKITNITNAKVQLAILFKRLDFVLEKAIQIIIAERDFIKPDNPEVSLPAGNELNKKTGDNNGNRKD